MSVKSTKIIHNNGSNNGSFHLDTGPVSQEYSVTNKESKYSTNDSTSGYEGRHIQVAIVFLGVAISFSFRAMVVVAIEAMLDNSENPSFPSYDWPNPIPDIIKGSFFFGCVIGLIPASRLIAHKGIIKPLGIAMLVCSLVTLAIPVTASIHWSLVVVCRVCQGLTQALMFPSVYQMIPNWIPVHERGRVMACIQAGAQFGTIISLPIAGYLAVSSFGWVSIFYFNALIGIAWSVVWFIIGKESPKTKTDRNLTTNDFNFMESSLKQEKQQLTKVKVLATPWKSILLSSPFWAVAIAHCGNAWGYWTVMSQTPVYFKNVLNLQIKHNGIMTSLPYLGKFLFSFVSGYFGDLLINQKILSTAASRKLFNSIGFFVPAAMLIVLPYISKENVLLCEVILVIAVSSEAAAFNGFNLGHIDIAPNFSGTLFGLTNTMANVFCAMAPIFCGLLLSEEDKTDSFVWKLIFLSAASIYSLSGFWFLVFSSSKIQSWNNSEQYQLVKS